MWNISFLRIKILESGKKRRFLSVCEVLSEYFAHRYANLMIYFIGTRISKNNSTVHPLVGSVTRQPNISLPCGLSRFKSGIFYLFQKGWICYWYFIDSSCQCPQLVYQILCHMLCLFDNAYKESLAICYRSRISCPISRLLAVNLQPYMQERWYDSI